MHFVHLKEKRKSKHLEIEQKVDLRFRRELEVGWVESPLLDVTSMVMHSVGLSSNSMKIVVNAGSMTKGTRKRKAKRLKVPRRMKNAVV